MTQILYDWYGFQILEYDDVCAKCNGTGADTEVNGVMLHKECAESIHESPEYTKAWKEHFEK